MNASLLRSALPAALLALAVGACSGSKPKTVASASTTAVPAQADEDSNWVGRDRIKEALALLGDGNPVAARKHVAAVLKKQPGDMIARSLLDQIDGDPTQMLGAQSYSYTLKDGDTLSSLAQKHLGNPMMFYALARYNGIVIPTGVAPGQTILIPGKKPVQVAVKKAPKPAAAKPTPAAKVAKAAPPAAKPARPVGNPAQAARLRGQGLAALNAGSIDRAVALLRQALSLDPASALIRGDLARALRVQSTLRGR